VFLKIQLSDGYLWFNAAAGFERNANLYPTSDVLESVIGSGLMAGCYIHGRSADMGRRAIRG
jgi:hypothetical protein